MGAVQTSTGADGKIEYEIEPDGRVWFGSWHPNELQNDTAKAPTPTARGYTAQSLQRRNIINVSTRREPEREAIPYF